MRAITSAFAALVLCACATSGAQHTDTALAAFQTAHIRECPPDQVQTNAHTSGEPQSIGATVEDVAIVPAADARAVRLRRITVAPGGAIAWHDHRAVQGMALILSGEMVETRNTCRERMLYRAGDIAREDAETAHSWRNESSAPAVVLVAHVIARP